MCLSHPQTIPDPQRQSVENMSSTKLVPGSKNFGDVKRLSQDHSKVCHFDLHFVSQKPENKSSQLQPPALTNLKVSLHQRVQ